MSLHEYRNPNTLILGAEATAYEAARAMADRQLGSVVVVEHGAVAGILTDRDLMLDIVARAVDPHRIRVDAIMRRNVATVDVEASVDDVAYLMRANACRRLPITQDGRVIGIVTLDDLLLDRALPRDALSAIVGSQLELAESFAKQNRRQAGRARESSVLGLRLRLRKRQRAHADATYNHFLDEVKDNASLPSREDAETALLVTLGGICRRITPGEAHHLLAQLPSILRAELEPWIEGPDKDISADVIETELRAQLGLGESQAAEVLVNICRLIVRHISTGLTDSLRTNLPEEMKELFPAP